MSATFEQYGRIRRLLTTWPMNWPADWIPPQAAMNFPSMIEVPGRENWRMKPLLETMPPFKLISVRKLN